MKRTYDSSSCSDSDNYKEPEEYRPMFVIPNYFILGHQPYKWLYGENGVLINPHEEWGNRTLEPDRNQQGPGIWTLLSTPGLREYFIPYIVFNMLREANYTRALSATAKGFWNHSIKAYLTGHYNYRNPWQGINVAQPIQMPLWAAFRTQRYVGDDISIQLHHKEIINNKLAFLIHPLELLYNAEQFDCRPAYINNKVSSYWRLVALPVRTAITFTRKTPIWATIYWPIQFTFHGEVPEARTLCLTLSQNTGTAIEHRYKYKLVGAANRRFMIYIIDGDGKYTPNLASSTATRHFAFDMLHGWWRYQPIMDGCPSHEIKYHVY